MNFIVARLPYRQTQAFSKIALDYIDQLESLKEFFAYSPTLSGIQNAINTRKQFSTDRKTLVQELKKQYDGITTGEKVQKNIEALLSTETFTVTTAHQNNIFTGPLYFIYKIMHAIKLADSLHITFPQQHFVPVFYMGTEDADFDELNHIWLRGEKLIWETNQTGAVGRMKIDQALLKLIGRLEGQISLLPHGKEIISLLRNYYREGTSIQEATFQLVNHLFADYGLVVLLPDNAVLKKNLIPVFEDELLRQTASGIVGNTTKKLQAAGYKEQASPRDINLFYLINGGRYRIAKQGNKFKVLPKEFEMTETELLQELHDHPERFSPNVILRGLYQEAILPNIVFIGGAAEIAYWLQLKPLFLDYNIPYPVLVLRNSFCLVEKFWKEKISRTGFTTEDFFLSEQELMNRLVKKESRNVNGLNGLLYRVEELYNSFKKKAAATDPTLEKHVEALKSQSMYRLRELEKKMLRAEKRKVTDRQRQLHAIKEYLFPGGKLQERRDNLCYYYAKWGAGFIQQLYDSSLCLEQEFTILTEQ